MDVATFEQALARLEAAQHGPILSASFDVRAGGQGEPPAKHVLREALRSTKTDGIDVDGARYAERIAEAIEAVAQAGHAGSFMAGPLDDPTAITVGVPLAPRNRVDVGERSARFELERYHALTRTPVATVWCDRSTVAWAIVQAGRAPLVDHIDSDTHHMQGAVGRTGQHDRGGSAAMPAGGHSKTNVEQSAEEERERFARAAAARLDTALRRMAVVAIHGHAEFRARLTHHLAPDLLERVLEVDGYDRAPDADRLVAEARARAAAAQYDGAERLVAELEAGGVGRLAVSGRDEIEPAIVEGRLAALVLDEDAAGHFGDVNDVRYHPPAGDPHRDERLLRGARDQVATCWFMRADPETRAGWSAGEPLGITRW